MGESISSTLHIAAGAPATIDSTGFEALTWGEVGNIANIGERGDSHANIATPGDLKTGRVSNHKGAADGGEISISCHTEDFDDSGQDTVRTACAATGSSSLYSIKVTNPAGDVEYYTGHAANFRRNEKSATSYEGCSFVFRVNQAPVIVEAS